MHGQVYQAMGKLHHPSHTLRWKFLWCWQSCQTSTEDLVETGVGKPTNFYSLNMSIHNVTKVVMLSNIILSY